jgi:CDP-paratose 2-epimerase
MKILITGACGFVGSELARFFTERGAEVIGIDNLSRPGSERNWRAGVIRGDVRKRSDVEALPQADWVIEAAANPSVLAGVDGKSSGRQVVEHNLLGGLEMLEYCRERGAGMVVLSSSRVYSIAALRGMPPAGETPGIRGGGIAAEFPTTAPVSVYGATKLALETMALEYGEAYGFPVWVDRCGVLAGAGQFGTAEQGIFAYWIHSHFEKKPLRYLGFGGTGRQVRDAFHPRDLGELIARQIESGRSGGRRVYTAGGGEKNAMSLAELTAWCDARFGPHAVTADGRERAYDLPWVVMSNEDAAEDFGWRPRMGLTEILEEIAEHAERNPGWLEASR